MNITHKKSKKKGKLTAMGAEAIPLFCRLYSRLKKPAHAHFGVKMAKELPLIIIHTTIMLKLQSNHKQK